MSKWEKVKLSDAFELRMGKTPSRNNLSYWNDGSNKWISIADIGLAEKYIYSTKETISDLAIKESGIKKVPKNTVIMSFKLSLGKTCIASEDMYTNEAIMAFINKGKYEIDEHYLYYLFKGKDWTAGTNKAVMGVTLNKATLSNVTIPVPSLEVQKKIAKNLDTVSELLALRKKQLEELDGLIKSVFYDMFGDPVTNDKGWEVVLLESALSVYPKNGLYKHQSKYGNGIKIIRIDSFYDGYVEAIEKLKRVELTPSEVEQYLVNKGDILINRVNSLEYLGKIGVVPDITEEIVYESNMMKFRLNEKNIIPIFLMYLWRTNFIKEQIARRAKHAVNQSSINQQDVLSITVVSPPIQLQYDFATIVTKIEEQKALVKQSIEETQTLFNSLMSQYFD